jgi:glutamate N-acetyltransferase/amino-acid N-acetyltransferase
MAAHAVRAEAEVTQRVERTELDRLARECLGDANWGRLAMAIGRAGEPIEPAHVGIKVGGHAIAESGHRLTDYDEAPVAAHIKTRDIGIAVNVGIGTGKARVWTCDLTHRYIEINADYRS